MATIQDLKNTGVFKSLSDDRLEAVIRVSEEKSFGQDEEIFKHGQKATTLYILLDGSVSLRIKAEEGIDLMAETIQETGSILGAASLIQPHVYNVTSKCIKSTKVLAIDSIRLQEIMRQDPAIGFAVMTELARLCFSRLNATRMAITNLFKIFKFQIHKSKVYDTYM